jgi:hypothetical protein
MLQGMHMGSAFRSQSLLPDGLIADDIKYTADALVATARSPSRTVLFNTVRHPARCIVAGQ